MEAWDRIGMDDNQHMIPILFLSFRGITSHTWINFFGVQVSE